MFHQKPIHVHDPEPAVRAGDCLSWAEPGVGGTEELTVLFVVSPPGAEGSLVGIETDSTNEIVNGFADKGVSFVLFPQESVTIDAKPTGRSDSALVV